MWAEDGEWEYGLRESGDRYPFSVFEDIAGQH